MTDLFPDEGNDSKTPGVRERRTRLIAMVAAIAVAVCLTAMLLAVGVAAILASSPASTLAKNTTTPTTAGPSSASTASQIPAVPGPSVPEQPTPPPSTTTVAPSEPPLVANKEATAFKIEVGECVDLTGADTGSIAKVACGGPDSSYTVVGKTEQGGSCPADADRTHDVDKLTLCLDIDWVVGGCLNVSGDEPQRVDCATGPGVEVLAILRDTTTAENCRSADRAFVYEERRFVVCFADL
ncbi:hypothetical protein B0T36_21565 [Nocardia donostiensis]|uniref:LppU/SCO3897 family protein n=1 Tax=Nocardia donostiensis TaxID=1538463 RepID=UPI0009D97F62|nr:hypothetical protein [Nocardia donostiensis]OQS13134.1 hypothetical protein B0T36_21565 [Nocardia donostiensis]